MALVLLGGGGHASDVLSVAEAVEAGGEAVFPVYVADDHWERPERFEGRGDIKLIESIEAGIRFGDFVVAVGYPATRRKLYDIAVGAGGHDGRALVHPNTSMAPGAGVDVGAVVMGQAWISPGVHIGRHSHISYGATIGHDTRIGPFSSIMPCACLGGDVVIGEGALVGANATILQGLSIGEGAIIGAGAVVTKDVKPHQTVVGVPARELVRE
ncbi:MAG: acetyltransferase [Acidimicrobiales bacterium]